MTRYTFISIGILIILTMFVLWGYLFLYGAPQKPREVFSNLGFLAARETDEVRTIEGVTPTPTDATRLAIGTGPLEQVTTRAVAGFTFLADAPETILYAERGTGHIFEIDLATELERQVSLTTVPQVVSAVFSDDGAYVALTTHEGYLQKTSVMSLLEEGQTPRIIELRDDAGDMVFTGKNTIAYSITDTHRTTGYERDLETLNEAKVFEVQLGDSITKWTGGKITIQPRPTNLFEGALYAIENSKLTPLTNPFTGFYGFLFNQAPLYSFTKNQQYTSIAHIGSAQVEQGIIMIDEKCVDESTNSTIWCAAPLSAEETYLESWYKGTLTSEDFLWKTDLSVGSSELLGDLPKLAGKTLDVFNLIQNRTSSKLLFSNKIDGTLWLYRVN